METAYEDGYAAGYSGDSWFACGYTGKLYDKWMRGFEHGRNARARANLYSASLTSDDWRQTTPAHGCGHMQGRGAA